MGVSAFLREVSGTLLDIVLPRRCVLCGSIHGPGEGDICRTCSGRLQADNQASGGTWTPFAVWSEDGFSGEREAVVSGGAYRGDLRRLIIAFKFQGREQLGRFLAARLMRTMARMEGEKPDVVLPVPLSSKRLKHRGYNQAAVLAEELAGQLSLPLAVNALERTRETGFQSGLDRRGRWENVGGAFKVTDPHRVDGRSVLLVDDLYTTGATVYNCTEALFAAGVKKVFVAVAAMAPAPRSESVRAQMKKDNGGA